MNIIAAWLLTVAIHGVVLLLAAWTIDTWVPSLRGAWRELLWRTALFGCVLTATLQVVSQQSPLQQSPLGGRWNVIAESAPAAVTIATPAPISVSAGKADPVASSQTLRVINHPAPQAGGSVTANSAVVVEARALAWSRLSWIVGVWLAGALFMLGRTTLNLLRLRQTLAAAVAVPNHELRSDLAVLATQAGIAEPQLLSLDAIPSPIAAPFARIVLPVWAIDTLDPAQLQAMLAHELAHIVRGDATWKLLTAYWRALFWFVPLTILAQRRLDDIAELACDAFAAQHTGDGRRLAECLTACAEHHVLGYTPELAPAMAARQSSLLYRIERLLEGVTMESTTTGTRARGVALLTLLVAAASLPAIGFDTGSAHAAPAPQPAAQKEQHAVAKTKKDDFSFSVHEDDSVVNGSVNGHDMTSISMSDAEHKFTAKVDGKIAIATDETDVASLSAGGTAKFEETRAGTTRRIELASRADKLERRYFINGAEQPYDDNARKFMAVATLELVRSGIGAEARAKRLYASGGAKGVLDEIDHVHSDYVRGIYLKLLADMGKMRSAELDRAIQIAGAMESDYSRRQALSALFDTQALDAASQVTFLHQSLNFSSDYERAELLVGAEPHLANTPEVRQAWLDAALGVKSDYERRRTLQSMLTGDRLDDAQLARVIQASDSMDSDYEHRELLVAAVHQARDVNALAPAYTRAAQGLKSDYEHKEALLALINAGTLGSSGADAVLAAAAQIQSSYECREVLIALARVMPKDANLIAHYREVAKRLPEYDRGEAESALNR
jgi:beta-lactamase regulating signal transducer with metallopeptidase domain